MAVKRKLRHGQVKSLAQQITGRGPRAYLWWPLVSKEGIQVTSQRPCRRQWRVEFSDLGFIASPASDLMDKLSSLHPKPVLLTAYRATKAPVTHPLLSQALERLV